MAFRSAEILSANTKKTRSRSSRQGKKKKSKFLRWLTCNNLKLATTNPQPEGIKQIVHSSTKILLRSRHAAFVHYLHLKYPDKRVCFRSQVQVNSHHFGGKSRQEVNQLVTTSTVKSRWKSMPHAACLLLATCAKASFTLLLAKAWPRKWCPHSWGGSSQCNNQST